MSIKWIRHEQIEAWADRQTAQALLPKLISKLILATNNSVKRLCFPYDNAIVLPSFDGVCMCESSSFLVPKGESVWEMGTNKDYYKKYKGDIEKRTKDSGKFDISKTSFIFVTPRMWSKREGKDEFIKKEIKKYGWKDICIIDSFNLEQWLEEAPTVAVWFAEQLGSPIEGLESASEYYSSYANTVKGLLAPSFFLSERISILDKLKETIDNCFFSNPFYIYVSNDCTTETIMTLIAYFKENNFNELLDKIVIVKDTQSLRNLCLLRKNDYIAIVGYQLSDSDRQYVNNMSLIIPKSDYCKNELCENKYIISLPKLASEYLKKSLISIGFKEYEAKQLIISSDGNIEYLLRKISSNPCYDFDFLDSISDVNDLKVLLTAIVANKWSDKNLCDRDFLSFLSGMDYDSFRNHLFLLSQKTSTIVCLKNNDYWCLSDEQVWLRLNKYITVDFVENLKKKISDDFVYHITTEEMVLAYNKQMYSPGMVIGIIHSIFMLRNLINKEIMSNLSLLNFNGDIIVKDLLEKSYFLGKWSNIEHWLSKLAEAAPNGFLEFWENHINKTDFKKFLDDINFYPIIWALEILSQIEDYSNRAILVLMTLCDYSDSAIKSLNECLCLWYSQSAISLENKKCFIKKIVHSKNIYRFKIVDLWLDNYKSVDVHQNPIWTKITIDIGLVTNKEYLDLRYFVAENFIENIDSSFECWQIIINHLDCLINFEDKVLAKLIELQKEMNFSTKIDICRKVANLISLKENKNNLQDNTIKLLREIYTSLSSIDEVRLIVYFTYIDLAKLVKSETECNFQMLKTRELSNYYNKYGLEAIIAVLPKIEFKDSFANAFSELLINNVIVFDSIFEIKLKDDYIARCIVRHVLEKNASLINFNAVKNDANRMWLISCLPLIQNTLNIIVKEPIEVRQYFWQHIDSRTDCYDDPNFAFSCFNGFIRNGRLEEAIEAIYLSYIREYKRIKSVLNDILDYCTNNIDIEAYKHVDWSSLFDNLFKEIRFENNEELLELAELEWNISPYLCWGRRLLFITKAVYIEPSFFIKLIEFVYKLQIKSNNKRYLLSKSEQNLWLFTEIILDNISELGKEFDIYSDNNYWLKTVEKIVHEKGLWEIYSHYLCRILANSPEDKDGVWPCHCLEDYLERQSDDFLEQFKEYKYNIADPLKIDTGVLTNKKADDFLANSKALEINHPRLAKVLRELSDYYHRLAEDEKDFFKRHNDYYSD